MQVSFLEGAEAVVKIVSSLKPNHHNQVKLHSNILSIVIKLELYYYFVLSRIEFESKARELTFHQPSTIETGHLFSLQVSRCQSRSRRVSTNNNQEVLIFCLYNLYTVKPVYFWSFPCTIYIQSNLCTTTTLEIPNLLSLLTGCRCSEVTLGCKKSNLDFKLMISIDKWSLFGGGR